MWQKFHEMHKRKMRESIAIEEEICYNMQV